MGHRHVLKEVILAIIGGLIYILIELIWRGHTHISMFILGGICFVAIGLINELFSWELGLVWQSVIGAVIVTVLEFITGLIVNIWLGLGVWDYSNMPFNLLGQICLPFAFAWIALSAIAIVLDDYLRFWIFGEEKPRYKLI
jgi:uncharacterized membrane protein|nr:MAG TPA: Putative ABC-transporter type IV [Caudoviricetes sp.]